MRIFVDMDNVLTQFNKQMITYLRRTNLELIQEKVEKTWEIAEWFEGDKNRIKKSYAYIMSSVPGFWAGMEIMPGAKEVMDHMMKYHEVYIATAAFWGDTCIPEKVRWIRNHLRKFDLNNLIFTQHKELLKGDVIIDDKPKTLTMFEGGKIKWSYPYNIGVEADVEVVKWEQVPAALALIGQK